MPTARILDSLSEVDAAQWDALAGDNPFVRHAFLSTLEETGCVSERTGWTPRTLTLWDGPQLTGAMPLYLKSHSYGEYVFDWAWARAYHEHGVDYYPKLLCAVPFTPVRGPRLMAQSASMRTALLNAAVDIARAEQASSLHVLFAPNEQLEEMRDAGLMLRSTVQFHWHNAPYENFEHFLSGMNHDKRKKIKQERRKVREAGIQFLWRNGAEASADEWEFFCRCYFNTYREHGSSPYLNRRFFHALAQRIPDNLLLILAMRDGQPIACALNVHTDHALYGRYWGCSEFVPGLHFEACYYQAIEFCIERGIDTFEGGAQGEHKLARGLLPVRTPSAHWIAHPGFAQAIEHYLKQEGDGIGRYVNELNEHSPFKGEQHAV